jgi:hypothetical protein
MVFVLEYEKLKLHMLNNKTKNKIILKYLTFNVVYYFLLRNNHTRIEHCQRRV